MFRSVFRPTTTSLFPAATVVVRNATAALHTLRPLSVAAFRPALSATQRPAAAAAANWSFGSARRYSPITIDEPAKILEFPQVQELVAKKDDQTVIVDVREPSEFAEGHIPSAINIPVKSSPGALGLEPEEFHDTFGFDKPDLEKTLVFYCLAGVRSTSAEELACTFGYQKRGNYKGSWDDWVKNGGKIEGQAAAEAKP